MDEKRRPPVEDIKDVDDAGADGEDGDATVEKPALSKAEIECFIAFYKDQYRLIVSLLMLWSGCSVQEAEDAAQQAFTEVYQRWPEIEFPKSYVRTTAINARKRARDRTARMGLSDQVEQDLAEPDDAFDAVTGYAWVEWVIKDLPPGQQRVVRAITDGLSYEQIAALLGTNEVNVRSHLRHVRNRLKTRPDLLALVPAAQAAAHPVATSAPTPGKGEKL